MQVWPHVQSFKWKQHVVAYLARESELMTETFEMNAQNLQDNTLNKDNYKP